jgi:hypothetical protein
MKLKPVYKLDSSLYGYSFECPGCGYTHVINIVHDHPDGCKWNFNGDVNQPEFSPSILVTCGHYVVDPPQPQPPNCEHCNDGHTCCMRCHFFITKQDVELPDIITE